MSREINDAQHEAAHVVVGVALGLHLRKAVLTGKPKRRTLGYAQFIVPKQARMAWGITLAAGVAFERRAGDVASAEGDLAALAAEGFDDHAVASLVIAADALLETRGLAHARVTRALLARDLVNADVEAIARGERVEVEG